MSDPLSALRSIVAGMTPGPWAVEGVPGSVSLVNRDTDDPHWDVAEVYHEPNAAGIVAALNLLRFVADPASVLKLQSAMVRSYHKAGGIDAASTGLINVERHMIEAILAALAAAATGGGDDSR